jgi:hypothetical protein
MKKILTIVLVASLLLACNPGSEKEETHQEHSDKATGLVLNNGAKWKADSTTATIVALLQTIVSNAKKESLESYVQTADQLQDGLNKMVSECKMKGADHEALHHWLEPLMEKTKELKNATTTENAAVILSDIESKIKLFTQYFE